MSTEKPISSMRSRCWLRSRKRFSPMKLKNLMRLSQKIKKEIEAVLSIGVKVTLVEPKTIQRSEGKAKRIVDKRTI